MELVGSRLISGLEGQIAAPAENRHLAAAGLAVLAELKEPDAAVRLSPPVGPDRAGNTLCRRLKNGRGISVNCGMSWIGGQVTTDGLS